MASSVFENHGIEEFNTIPILAMRANSLIELDLAGRVIGVEGGLVVAHLLRTTTASIETVNSPLQPARIRNSHSLC